MVVVQMVTYNHEKYVEQAIESVMMQKTSFRYKLIIAEDYSTDRTREICIELKNKYPDKIDLLLNSRNLGVTLNALQVHKACIASGAKYVAICEGDDYWTDPLKLQKQVDFLESNSDFILCAHYRYLQDSDEHLVLQESPISDVMDGADLAHGVTFHSATALFRNFKSESEFPFWIVDCPIADWALFVYLGQFGHIKILAEHMMVYRFTRTGIFSSLSVIQSTRNYIQTASMLLQRISENQTRTNLKQLIAGQYIKLLSLHHSPSIEKNIRLKVFREIHLTGVRYSWKQYRYMIIYLFDIFFKRRKFSIN